MEKVNGYELNKPGESADWSQREFNLLSAFAGLMPACGSKVVSAGEHFHNILTNQNGVPALSITSDGTVAIEKIESSSNVGNKFLVDDETRIRYRTAAQVLSDIGAQAALTNPVTGTGIAGRIPKFSGMSTLTNSVIYEADGNIGLSTTPTAFHSDMAWFDGTPKMEISTGTGTGVYNETVVIRHGVTSSTGTCRKLGLIFKHSSEESWEESWKWTGIVSQTDESWSSNPFMFFAVCGYEMMRIINNDGPRISIGTIVGTEGPRNNNPAPLGIKTNSSGYNLYLQENATFVNWKIGAVSSNLDIYHSGQAQGANAVLAMRISEAQKVYFAGNLGVGITPHDTYPVAIGCSTEDLYITDFEIKGGSGYIHVSNGGSATGYIEVHMTHL